MTHEQDLSQVVDRPNIDRALAVLDEEIAAVEDAERKHVFAALREGSLEPQAALQSWMRLEALDAVRSKLIRRDRKAQAASRRVEPNM